MPRIAIRLMMTLAIVMACGARHGVVCADNGTIADFMENMSGGRVQVHQPGALNERLKPENGDSTNVSPRQGRVKELAGYRIQVFSDKNQRTARSEALARESNIKAYFPEMGTYISYTAPSWRLRVGDFRTREEAREALEQLREAFPSYAGEMIIVVDRIKSSSL